MIKSTIIKASLLGVALLSLPALAIFNPNWERPLEMAKLEVQDSRGVFQEASELQVYLNKRDGAKQVTSITVNYKVPSHAEFMEGQMTNVTRTFAVPNDGISKDECGNTVYTINSSEMNHDRLVGARTNITLIDYRTAICEYKIVANFEFSMREGFGWCGTMDSTVHAFGNPEPVFTIQEIE
jgi:hypothetical protein